MSIDIILAAKKIINEAIPVIEQHYGKELPELRLITLKTSKRMTRTFGQAQIKTKSGRKMYIVKLSTAVYKSEHIQTRAFRNTVVHEIAHIAEALIYNRSMSHSLDWAAIMNVCGEQAARFATIEKKAEIDYVRPPKRKMKKYIHKCDGGCSHTVGGQIHNKIMKGRIYTCRKTGTVLQTSFEVTKG